MSPPNNSHVKILLRNNTTAEGIVEEWGDIVKLQSLDGRSYMVIPRPKEDIILFKVFLEKHSEEQLQEAETELEQQFQQTIKQPSEDPARIKNLATLRLLLAQQDRQIIANKLKSHHIGQTRKVEYGSPRFLTKRSPE